jgi:hypothetical protein
MAYVKRGDDGLYRVYDDECSGVISGPYATEAEAQSYCDAVNAE